MRGLEEVGWLRAPSEGPPLVLVHGAGANASVWAGPMRALSAFDCVAPDLPGRGESVGPARASASENADWLADVLTSFGGPPPIVLGHSYGGAVAIELALSARIELSGLVLVATGGRLRVHPSVLAMAEAASDSGEVMPTRFAFLDAAADCAESYEEAASSTPPEATLADWRACDAFDRLDALAAVETPTLVVCGGGDVLTPTKYHQHLADALPRASLRVIERAGHMLPWEQPAALGSAVRAWTSAIAAPA